jgi:hypothetical protein
MLDYFNLSSIAIVKELFFTIFKIAIIEVTIVSTFKAIIALSFSKSEGWY